MFRQFRLFLVLAALVLSATAAHSADVDWSSITAGQFITATATRNVHAGPGVSYLVVDTVGPGEQLIITGECRSNWCEIDHVGVPGWVYFSDAHAEGWEPVEQFAGTDLNWGRGGPGEVCFYDGPNYTGSSLCLTSGINYPDMAAVGADNWISSVRVTGEASATICRDADYRNYCILVVQDHPRLNRILDNAVSSITVY
jgi:hypothetical protein